MLLKILLSGQAQGLISRADLQGEAAVRLGAVEAVLRDLVARSAAAEPPAGVDAAAREAALVARATEALSINIAKASVDLLAGALAFADEPEYAHRVRVIGSVTLDLADSVSQLRAANLGGFLGLGSGLSGVMNGLSLAGNVLGAITTIAQLFGPQQPSADALILEAIESLRRDVQALRREMHGRFDQVDRAISALQLRMDAAFERVFEGIAAVRAELYEISVELQRIERNVLDYIVASEDRRFSAEYVRCITLRGIFPALSPDALQQCYATFFNWAVNASRDVLALGGSARVYTLDELDRELSRVPWASNVRYTPEFCRRMGWSNIAVSPPNPMVWQSGANALIELLLASPAQTRSLDVAAVMTTLDLVAGVGEDYNTAASATRKFHIYRNVMAVYTSTLDDLRRSVVASYRNHAGKVYEREWAKIPTGTPTDLWPIQAKGIIPVGQDGLDSNRVNIWWAAGAEEVPAAELGLVLNQRVRDHVVLPNGFVNWFPPSCKYAEAIGLGRVAIRYSENGWQDVRRLACPNGIALAGRHRFVVHVLFLPVDGSPPVVCMERAYLSPDTIRFAGKQPGSASYNVLFDLGAEFERTLWLVGFQSWEGSCHRGSFILPVIQGFIDRATPINSHENARNYVRLREMVEAYWLRAHHRDILANVVAESKTLSSPIRLAANRLTGLRLLVQSLMRMHFPRSILAEDAGRGLISGSTGIPSGDDVLAGLETREEVLTDAFTANWAQTAAVLLETIEKTIDTGEPETLAIVSETLQRLSNLKLFVEQGTFPDVDRPCWVTQAYCPEPVSAGGFVRGDANVDGRVDISDAVEILGSLFLGNPGGLRCDSAGDVDDSGNLNVTDPIAMLAFLFLGGPPPLAPYPGCGTDGSPDVLECAQGSTCAI